MKNVLFILFILLNSRAISQKNWTNLSIDSIPFDEDSCTLFNTFLQNGIALKVFYCNKEDSKYYKTLCIVKNENGKSSIILKQLFNSDKFDFEDINKDGFIDFCITYHDFNIVHFYDTVTKSFHINADAWLPYERKLLDKKKLIFCDSYGLMYGYENIESTLYFFDGLQVKWLYKIVFVSSKPYSGDSIITSKLYKLHQRKNQWSAEYIKDLEIRDFEKYYLWWKKNYKELLKRY